MSHLNPESPIDTIKFIDFAINQINSADGVEQIKFYLFNGSKIQKTSAALYFKRHGYIDILREAIVQNCIDKKQAFSW